MDEENSQNIENSISPKPINARYNKRATLKETPINGLHFEETGSSKNSNYDEPRTISKYRDSNYAPSKDHVRTTISPKPNKKLSLFAPSSDHKLL
jgi:hypothetical protein